MIIILKSCITATIEDTTGEPMSTVDITEALPQAQRVPAHAVIPGDFVFDAFGRTYAITDTKVTSKRDPVLWIRRSDRPNIWEPWTALDAEVTIIPTLEGRKS